MAANCSWFCSCQGYFGQHFGSESLSRTLWTLLGHWWEDCCIIPIYYPQAVPWCPHYSPNTALSASIYKCSLLPQSLNTFYKSGLNLLPWMKLSSRSCPSGHTNPSTFKVKWGLMGEFLDHPPSPAWAGAHGVGDPYPWEIQELAELLEKGSEPFLHEFCSHPGRGRRAQTARRGWSALRADPHTLSTTTDPTPAPPPCPRAFPQPKNGIFSLMLLLGCCKNWNDRHHALCRVGLGKLHWE